MFQHFLRAFPLCSSTVCVYFFRLFGPGVSNVLGGFLDCVGMLLGCLTFWDCFRLLVGWTVCMHLYCIPALFACISVFACYSVDYIFSVFQHCMRAYLLCSSTFLRAFLLCVSTVSVRIPTAFQHWLRAFLLHSSTFSCVHFYYTQHFLRAHFYSVPALSAWISTALQHSLHAFVSFPSTLCVHFHCASVCMYFSWLLNVTGGFLDCFGGLMDRSTFWEAFFIALDHPWAASLLMFWEAFWTALGCFWGA